MTLHHHINKYSNPRFNKGNYENFMRNFKSFQSVKEFDILNIRRGIQDIIYGILKSNVHTDYVLCFDLRFNKRYSEVAGYPVFEIVDCGEFESEEDSEKVYGTVGCMTDVMEIMFNGSGLSVYIWFDKFEG